MTFLNALTETTGSLLYIVPSFLFVLTVVVFIHELGHFLVGRWCGVGVTSFSIGFGPEIAGFTDRRGTRWKLSAIPLGGYVKFVGDQNGASVPDPDSLARMSADERAISFHTQPVWKRIAIVAAGPAANFLLAVLVFAGSIYALGRMEVTPLVSGIQPGSAAARAGFQVGDVVQAINGRPVTHFADMQRIVSGSGGETLRVTVERGGVRTTLEAVPDTVQEKTPFGTHRLGRLGIQGPRDAADVKLARYGLVDSLRIGVSETYYVVERTFDYMGKLITGRESADQLSGPMGIARVSGQAAKAGGLSAVIGLIAVLSVSIGLINLFPVPLLDGGHLMFYAVEVLRGRPLSERAQEIGFRIGLALVLMLMLFATWNDIVQIGTSWTRGT
ncbi:membrane-associated zinc metalloprotease [Methylobacterium sp. 4-46]|uniref:RIP metalloprotease RseP n=1 Tax=unclassified Methylobacterium TaxID=2615210 RepID=UPI000152CCAB|nr:MULTISPECIES: RIP metalloprotease RseP [Methylobacterium]ACA15198.1 membrane-associated zinc metalloprotease [Methylobacterium sp. 4-46]WFT80929.1 RIP metalloprotease RseP [Methylobacterium nodulans]